MSNSEFGSARECGTRMAGFLVLATLACVFTGFPRGAAGQGYSVLWTFPFGEEQASLGFVAGDTIAYDQHARLAAVDDRGWSYILDEVNARLVIVGPSGPTVYQHDSLGTPMEVLGLVGGRFVVGGRGAIRTVDSAGNAVAEARRTGLLDVALVNGHFIVREPSGGKYLEYSPDLELRARHSTSTAFSPWTVDFGEFSVVRFGNACWSVPKSLSFHGGMAFRSGDRLRYFTSNGFVEARSGGEVVKWTERQDEFSQRTLPSEVVALGDATTVAVWKKISQALGLDGNFYSLVQTPAHYELIRWDMDALPKETHAPIPNSAPSVVLDGPTHVAVGTEHRVWVRGHDAEPGTLALTVGDLPDGARFTQSRRGNKAALDWEPTPEQVGEHTIHVTVEDLMCGRTTQSFVITVQE